MVSLSQDDFFGYSGITPTSKTGFKTTDDKSDKRLRLQTRFWLDVYKDDESWLSDWIAYLKSERLFMPTCSRVMLTC
jgi:hypothetical protein